MGCMPIPPPPPTLQSYDTTQDGFLWTSDIARVLEGQGLVPGNLDKVREGRWAKEVCEVAWQESWGRRMRAGRVHALCDDNSS
jgi:hypothetical protein